MKLYEQFICKRLALGFTTAEMASIAKVTEGAYTLFEKGEKIDYEDYNNITNRIESYIRNLDREMYLTIRIREETLMLTREPKSEHTKTLGHLQIHVAKLNMMYVGDKNWD